MHIMDYLKVTLVLLSPTSLHAQLDWRDVGDILQVLLPLSAYSATAIHQDLHGAWEFTEAFSTSLASSTALKYTVDRERPNGSVRSFPSGHTTSAFSAATFLQKRYGVWYGIPAFGLATLTGYSRVKSHQHWTSDVVAGAALGVATNLYFTDRYRLTPVITEDSKSVQIEMEF